jgi:hypothetical protein
LFKLIFFKKKASAEKVEPQNNPSKSGFFVATG